MRSKHGGVIYRVLYFFHGRMAAVVSHGITKQQATVVRVPHGSLLLAAWGGVADHAWWPQVEKVARAAPRRPRSPGFVPSLSADRRRSRPSALYLRRLRSVPGFC